jgi:hypothetical protein
MIKTRGNVAERSKHRKTRRYGSCNPRERVLLLKYHMNCRSKRYSVDKGGDDIRWVKAERWCPDKTPLLKDSCS